MMILYLKTHVTLIYSRRNLYSSLVFSAVLNLFLLQTSRIIMVEKENKEPKNGNLTAIAKNCQELLMSEKYAEDFAEQVAKSNLSKEEIKKLLMSIYQKLGLEPGGTINNFAGNQVIGQYQLIVDGDMLSKLVGGLASALKDNLGDDVGATLFKDLCKAFIDKL